MGEKFDDQSAWDAKERKEREGAEEEVHGALDCLAPFGHGCGAASSLPGLPSPDHDFLSPLIKDKKTELTHFLGLDEKLCSSSIDRVLICVERTNINSSRTGYGFLLGHGFFVGKI